MFRNTLILFKRFGDKPGQHPVCPFMARNFTFLLLFSILASAAFAQSGRVKTKEPTPSPVPPSRVIISTTEARPELPRARPTPTPAPVVKNSGEDDGEVIRVSSALVPIPVSVTDAEGRAVANLRLEDFELTVDGKAETIGEMSRSDTPVRLALLFDNSLSVAAAREFEKKAAVRFFRRVIRPEKDLAALYSVATNSRLEQPLTRDVSSLIDAIENFPKPAGATALLDAVIKASIYLKEHDGRRVIVIVSDGEDNLSDATLEQTVRALQLNNCQVYVVKTNEFENFKQTGIRAGSANVRFLAAERRMQEIAAQTGGAVYSPVDERELDAAFARISAELSQQYILNYYPEEIGAGGFRTITLNLKNKNGLTVRARKGFYASR